MICVSLASTSSIFAHPSHTESTKKTDQSSSLEYAADLFGVCTNTVSVLSGLYTLRQFHRQGGQLTHSIHAMLTAFELGTHGINLAGFGSKLSDTVADWTGIKNDEEGVCSPKLLGMNTISLLYHISNFFLVERKGLFQLFNLYDLFEITGHANDIRASCDFYEKADTKISDEHMHQEASE